MAGFHHCLEKAGVPFRNVGFPGTPAACNTKAPKETNLINLVESSTYSGGLDSQSAAECSAEADDVAGAPPNNVREMGIQRDQEPLVGHGNLNVWSHPGAVERVRLYVCGRHAAAAAAVGAPWL